VGAAVTNLLYGFVMLLTLVVGVAAFVVVGVICRDHPMDRPNEIRWQPPAHWPPPVAQSQHAGRATYVKPREPLALPRGDR